MFGRIEEHVVALLHHAGRAVDALEEIARNLRDVAAETRRLADAVSNFERKGS